MRFVRKYMTDSKEEKLIFTLLPLITNPAITNNHCSSKRFNILNFKYTKRTKDMENLSIFLPQSWLWEWQETWKVMELSAFPRGCKGEKIEEEVWWKRLRGEVFGEGWHISSQYCAEADVMQGLGERWGKHSRVCQAEPASGNTAVMWRREYHGKNTERAEDVKKEQTWIFQTKW